MINYEKITPDVLRIVGFSLYGTHWQTELANNLGLSSARRLRAWLLGERDIPQEIRSDLIDLLLKSSNLSKNIAENLKKFDNGAKI